MCRESLCMVATVPMEGDEEGGEGSVGGGCSTRWQLAAIDLPQPLTQRVNGSSMAHNQYVPVREGEGGRQEAARQKRQRLHHLQLTDSSSVSKHNFSEKCGMFGST